VRACVCEENVNTNIVACRDIKNVSKSTLNIVCIEDT